ncbi:MAG: hypothetical protein R3C41_17055 [Calditrichia bacterium]
MIMHYLFAILAVFAMMGIWLIVQKAWQKSFSDYSTDEDALAGRGGCQGCSCSLICEKKLTVINTENE